MLIEDDPDDIEQFLKLAKKSWKVDVVQNGNVALSSILKIKPDMIFLDRVLPSKSGDEICMEIRFHPNLSVSSTPIAMVSCLHGYGQKMIGEIMGANKYISKPYSQKEICDTVSEFF